jgi:predicted nuclease with TOPRIM domain
VHQQLKAVGEIKQLRFEAGHLDRAKTPFRHDVDWLILVKKQSVRTPDAEALIRNVLKMCEPDLERPKQREVSGA